MSDLVVLGLGYVGLPLAASATKSGLSVEGLDVDEAIVAGLNAGKSHVDDLSDADINEMLSLGFSVSPDASIVSKASAV